MWLPKKPGDYGESRGAPTPDHKAVAKRSTTGVPFSSWSDLCARLQAAGVSPAACRNCLHKCA